MAMGCCGCEQQKFRFESRDLDEERLKIVLDGLRSSPNAEKYFEIWAERVRSCDCLCHVDGPHHVFC